MGLRVFTKALLAAERWPIAAAGDFIRCTAGDEPFDLTLNKPQDASGDPNATDFDRIEVLNGATPQTVTLYVGVPDRRLSGQETFKFENGFGYSDSELTDSRLTGQINISGGLSTKVSASSTIANAAASVTGSAASLVAAGSARIVLIRPTNGDIYVGSSSSVTTANGMLVKQEETLSYTSGDELFAISGGTVDVRILTEAYS